MKITAEKKEDKVIINYSDKEELELDEDYARDIQDCATGILGISAMRLANGEINDAIAIIRAIANNAEIAVQDADKSFFTPEC